MMPTGSPDSTNWPVDTMDLVHSAHNNMICHRPRPISTVGDRNGTVRHTKQLHPLASKPMNWAQRRWRCQPFCRQNRRRRQKAVTILPEDWQDQRSFQLCQAQRPVSAWRLAASALAAAPAPGAFPRRAAVRSCCVFLGRHVFFQRAISSFSVFALLASFVAFFFSRLAVGLGFGAQLLLFGDQHVQPVALFGLHLQHCQQRSPLIGDRGGHALERIKVGDEPLCLARAFPAPPRRAIWRCALTTAHLRA